MGKPARVSSLDRMRSVVLETSWFALMLFVALTLSVSLYGLTVSGHFPNEHRAQSLRTPSGAAVLWGTMALSIASAVYGIAFAAGTLSWYVAIIAGGAALLIAPLLLQPLPDRFVNGRRGLVTFAALASALALLAWKLGR